MAVTKLRWTDLDVHISVEILESLAENNFHFCTPVQAAVLPQFLKHKDVVVEAVTGSGKTLAFLVPILEILLRREDSLKKQEIGALIVSPTRELAYQIYDVLQGLIKNLSFTATLLVGGVLLQKNLDDLLKNGANIIVTTPGRFDDILQRPDSQPITKSLKSLEVLVLDEADRLLEYGFQDSLNVIFSRLPKQRRTGLFSATQTDEVKSLIRSGLRNPVAIVVKEEGVKKDDGQKTPAALLNYYLICEASDRFNRLVSLIRTWRTQKVLVFCATCACTDYYSALLSRVLRKKIPVLSIHGKMKKNRTSIFAEFRSMQSGVLLCTDVMARGIDVPNVDWVLQFDPPPSASSFVHRCGRTARLGHVGRALIMLHPNEDSFVNFIKINQKVPLSEFVDECVEADVMTKVRKISAADRAVYEKGLRAYVSFTQAYSKHEVSLIFNLKELDLCGLATGFGLLHLPSMPELRQRDTSGFVPVEMDYDSIPYLDKSREKNRLAEFEVKRAERRQKRQELKEKRKQNAPWSRAREARDEKRAKRDKRQEQKKRKREAAARDDPNAELELLRDARILKKLKRGKMTEDEYDKEMGISSESD